MVRTYCRKRYFCGCGLGGVLLRRNGVSLEVVRLASDGSVQPISLSPLAASLWDESSGDGLGISTSTAGFENYSCK